MITILLVDDQPIVREGLTIRLQLELDLRVVGEAKSGEEALLLAAQLHPNVVLMDIDLPCMDGIAAAAELRELAPQSAVVILSLCDDRRTREAAYAAGAVFFVSKHDPGDTLLGAIRRAADSNTRSRG
jgi:DNA-binding NarL/FixJ family response regulator